MLVRKFRYKCCSGVFVARLVCSFSSINCRSVLVFIIESHSQIIPSCPVVCFVYLSLIYIDYCKCLSLFYGIRAYFKAYTLVFCFSFCLSSYCLVGKDYKVKEIFL